jgi:hypothetical protein
VVGRAPVRRRQRIAAHRGADQERNIRLDTSLSSHPVTFHDPCTQLMEHHGMDVKVGGVHDLVYMSIVMD